MIPMTTVIEKRESDVCRDCGRESEGYFGSPWVYEKKNKREITIFSLCKHCFQNDAACAEAEAEGVRFTAIGVGIVGIYSPLGDRCFCGAVTHALLGFCIKCSKDQRMLSKKEGEKKLLDKLLKNLRFEIKEKVKESKNGN